MWVDKSTISAGNNVAVDECVRYRSSSIVYPSGFPLNIFKMV